jgi:hypothetical protein
MSKQIDNGQQVTFQYRKHYLLGGDVVRGEGVVIGQTIVGTEPAYIIQPTSGDCVHVRYQGVWALTVAA